jgi:hypothetical protein
VPFGSETLIYRIVNDRSALKPVNSSAITQ